MGQAALMIMEIFALSTSAYGLHYIYKLDRSIFSNMHNSLWFIFGILSNVSGIVSILMDTWSDVMCSNSNSNSNASNGLIVLRSLYALQYHYFFNWLELLVGYAGLVTESWMTYSSQIRLSHIHLALVGVPIVAWLKRKSMAIVVTTQMVTCLAILSHIYITYTVSNWWGTVGSILITLQIIAMSLPVRYTFFTEHFSTREAAIMFSGICSLVFCRGIAESAQYLRTSKRG